VLGVCLGADVGVLRARSKGLLESRQTNRLVLQTDLALRGALELGADWLATGTLALLVPLGPETFRYERPDGETENVFQMAPLALAAGVGIGYAFR
jgi:hypothetical protein